MFIVYLSVKYRLYIKLFKFSINLQIYYSRKRIKKANSNKQCENTIMQLKRILKANKREKFMAKKIKQSLPDKKRMAMLRDQEERGISVVNIEVEDCIKLFEQEFSCTTSFETLKTINYSIQENSQRN